tara:strand:- start:1382 stop:2452 length:1071 start_codon:yes stop_codon:yes gene_type:complete
MKKVYFFIGTKAQAIKCVPLINELLKNQKYKVLVIDSGQHVELVDSILFDIGNPVTRVRLYKHSQNISTLLQSVVWIFQFLKNYIFSNKNKLKADSGICIVHGDTLSTLLGLFWSKKNKIKVLHLESGLTSQKFFRPFPEELVRRIVSQFSDILICFDDDSFNNLNSKYKNSKKLIKKISENTIFDTISNEIVKKDNKLITVTLHRTETIISKARMKEFLNFLTLLSDDFKINWYLHEPTKNYLKKHNLKVSEKVNLLNLLDHNSFLHEIKKSAFVITDGGSIQEECYLLGKSTIIWRKTTERKYALNKNMFVSDFSSKKSYDFLINNLETKIKIKDKIIEPSKEIVEYLKEAKIF